MPRPSPSTTPRPARRPSPRQAARTLARQRRALEASCLDEGRADTCALLTLEIPDPCDESRVTVFWGEPRQVAAQVREVMGRPALAARLEAERVPLVGYLNTFYLHPSLRGGTFAQQCWETMRAALVARGVGVLWTHFGPGDDGSPSVLRYFMARLGFRPVPGVEDEGMPALRLDLAPEGSSRRPNPPASAALRGRTFYHGTDRADRAERILREGLRARGDSGVLADSRAHLAPVPGRVYLSQTLRYAQLYALGSGMAGHDYPERYWRGGGRWGYFFAVDGADLGEVEPDEDAVGAAMGHALDPPAEVSPYDDLPELTAALLADPARSALLADLARRVLTPRQLKYLRRGEMAHMAAAGKKALRSMSGEMKRWLLEHGASVAHVGPLPVRAAWRLDKLRSKELRRDGANLLEVAEPLALPGAPPARRPNPPPPWAVEGHWSRLTPEQAEVFDAAVRGRSVVDLGAGDGALSRRALLAGARSVLALEPHEGWGPPGVPFLRERALDFAARGLPIDVLVLGWPPNAPMPGLGALVDRAARVVYVGKNLSGSATGTTALWTRLARREVWAYRPGRRSTLIVYEGPSGPRDLHREERAALDPSRVYGEAGPEEDPPSGPKERQ